MNKNITLLKTKVGCFFPKRPNISNSYYNYRLIISFTLVLMNLSTEKWQEALLNITGKVDVTLMAKNVVEAPKNVPELWLLGLNSKEPICQRCGWVLEEAARLDASIVIPTLYTAQPEDVAHSFPLQRHFFKIWAEYTPELLPEVWVGDMFD
jgi:hypothetical protein